MIPRRRYDFSLEGTISGEWRADKSQLYTTTGRTTLATNSGDPVGSWSDLRGSNHAGQASASLRPTYNPNGLSAGKPAITFDGVDDVLSTPAMAVPAGTLFVVGKALENFTLANGFPGFVKYAATDTSVAADGVILIHETGKQYLANPPTTGWQNAYTIASILSGDVVLLTWRWGSIRANLTAKKNKVTSTSGANTGTYAAPASSMPMHFGASYSANKSNVSISHFLAFSATLTDAAILRIETEMSRIWGLGL